jgi:hypothetical protein
MSLVVKFDAAFKKAIANPENWRNQMQADWNFIEADIYTDLRDEGSAEEIEKIMSIEFDNMCSEYDGLEFFEIAAMIAE